MAAATAAPEAARSIGSWENSMLETANTIVSLYPSMIAAVVACGFYRIASTLQPPASVLAKPGDAGKAMSCVISRRSVSQLVSESSAIVVVRCFHYLLSIWPSSFNSSSSNSS